MDYIVYAVIPSDANVHFCNLLVYSFNVSLSFLVVLFHLFALLLTSVNKRYVTTLLYINDCGCGTDLKACKLYKQVID